METNRKVVIYGSGRYPKDFLYVFDKIQVAYYVDDEAGANKKSYQILRNEEKDKVFVIICKYNEKRARKNLEDIGFCRGVNYISATELFHLLDFPIKEIAKERNVYIWGTGEISHNFFHNFVEKNPDLDIVGCIDSDFSKKGKTFFRRPIYMPEEVINNSKNFFIIASTLYYQEIKEVLLKYGKKEERDFIPSLALNQGASWMMRETIYDIPRLNYVCSKAFQDVALMKEGRISVCAGVKDALNYIVPLYCASFESVWHSNVMKILRLSMINGTYSFCNEQKCDLKQNCGKRTIDTDELHYYLHNTKEQMEYVARKETLPRDFVFCDENYSIREKEYPDVVMCSFDRTCNLHCPSCRKEKYIADGKEKEVLFDFTKRIESELFPYVNRLKVAGDGETFFSEIYRSIVFNREIADKIHSIGILSNGTLLTPSNFDNVSKLYESINIFISMDGATKETAEKLRAGCNFERWMKNMNYLRQKREEGKIKFLSFNFVVQRANYLEMPEYVKMCLGFHADGIKFSQIRNTGWTEEEFEEISMFDVNGLMKPELAEIVKDEVFERPEVHLFTWIDW